MRYITKNPTFYQSMIDKIDAMDLGFTINQEKINNLMVYLSSKIRPLYKTKLLKLFYLIDEQATFETGNPVTWLKYKVWEKGPVAKDIYNEITFYDGNRFEGVVNLVHEGRNIKIEPNAEFCDLDFSNYEMKLIDKIILNYGSKSADELIEITHKKGGLWDQAVVKNNLLNKFKEDSATPFSIDLTDLIKEDPEKMDVYCSVKENYEFLASMQ